MSIKKKKTIIICIFLTLIIITAITTVVSAVSSYNYEMDPANGVDIMEGLEAVLIMMVGGFAILYELDLFYTVYRIFVKPKSVTGTFLNILANLSLLLSFFNGFYKDIFEEDVIAPLIVFAVYIVLRLVCFVFPERDSK